MARLIELTGDGLYCAAGDFHIDPWKPVPRAVLTHAHADHACRGCGSYLVSEAGLHVYRTRLGEEARLAPLPYGEEQTVKGVKVSLHPAGHILGSAQIRVEHRGEVWAVSGDYKVAPDATCAGFEPVRCDTFITEATFALPIFHWRPQAEVFAEINSWWRENREAGRTSVVLCYSLGKAQRILAGVDAAVGPIYTHGAVERLVEAYRRSGVGLPPTTYVKAEDRRERFRGALILAPPSAFGTNWMRRFAPYAAGFASGWMSMRRRRRQRGVDRGFVLSDHADWGELNWAVRATGAEEIQVTHGYVPQFVRWLRAEQGLNARPLKTSYAGDLAEEAAVAAGPS